MPDDPNQAATAAPPAEPPASTAVEKRTAPAPQKPAADKLPPFRVLLHNDSVNDMVFVVETLVDLAALPKPRAVHVMLEAHHQGVALVLVTHRERAELYRDQFESKGLTVTIEPAE